MNQLLNFFPPMVFFIFYKLYGIFIASSALMITSALALGASYLIYRKVGKMLLANFAMVTVFGTLTISLQNPDFIKWKVTIIYTLFTLILLFSHWFMKQTMIQKMLGKELHLPKLVWRRLNIAWASFFFSCGIANIYVAFWLSQDTWVNFKVFGLSALTLVFTIMSGMYIFRVKLQEKNNFD